MADEQYVPEGHYVVEDLDGERFVKKENAVTLPKDLAPAEYQAAAEKNPKGYWTPGMATRVLLDGVHQIFRETVRVRLDMRDDGSPTPGVFLLEMSNGDTFRVTASVG